MEKVQAYKVTLKANPGDVIPWVALIAEDTVLVSGTWLSLSDEKMDGVILGLELANYEVDVKEVEIVSAELKSSLDEEKIINYVGKYKP
jgi:hypothetical protein